MHLQLSRVQRNAQKYIHAAIQQKQSRIQLRGWIGTQVCVQSYNLITINQYANQGAAFMSSPQQVGETHTTDHNVAAGYFVSSVCQK